MSLLSRPIAGVRDVLARWETEGRARVVAVDAVPPWPAGESLLLAEDTAVELGGPVAGSIAGVLWSRDEDVCDGRVTRVGPDIAWIGAARTAFAELALVSGPLDDAAETYHALLDAVLSVRLDGFMVRALPTDGRIWCRVGRAAAARGFSLDHRGAALVRALRAVPGVRAAEVVLVTGAWSDLAPLEGHADEARRLTRTLLKLSSPVEHDCETCDLRAVCERVEDLRALRQKARGRQAEAR